MKIFTKTTVGTLAKITHWLRENGVRVTRHDFNTELYGVNCWIFDQAEDAAAFILVWGQFQFQVESIE